MEPQSGNAEHHRDDAPPTAAKDLDADRTLVAESVTINAPRADLYAFWREQTNLTQVMENVVGIETLDTNRARWTVKAPAGRTVTWVSTITEDIPETELTWQSEEGGDIDNSGRIEFRDAGARGTVVRATIAYHAPGGMIGAGLAKLFQREPRVQAHRELHRLKQLFEAGEIATGARNRREQHERGEDQTPATGAQT